MNEIACPNCRSPQSPQAVFCDRCGQRLIADPNTGLGRVAATQFEAPAPSRRTAEVVPPPAFLQPGPDLTAVGGTVVCPNCETANVAGAGFCDQCGLPLAADLPVQPGPPAAYTAEPPPREIPTDPERTAPPTQRPAPVQAAIVSPTLVEAPSPGAEIAGRLVFQASGHVFDLPAGHTELLVGREDPVSSNFPEIDLAPYGGEDGGVSRRHARFFLQSGTLMLEDLDSTNFTFVNRQRVMPGTRQVVRHGDEVRFGRVAARYEGP